MKKIKVSVLVVAVASLFFIGGAFAASQGWLSFTGDNAVENSKSDVDEIMSILEEVHAGKVSAEEALAELEALNPKGLVKKIKALEEENGKLVKENTDLRASNSNLTNTITELENRIAQLEEALANAPEDQSEYVAHLEAELQRANETVEELSSKTKSAVEKARTYK